MKTNKSPVLISACLTGMCTRYDGKSKRNNDCMQEIKDNLWIPVCPEQLGGLQTPREPADILGGDGYDVLDGKAQVITRSGQDVTEQFIRGAKLVLDIASQQNITSVILKARSPSCALHGKIGVTAALLQRQGLTLIEK